MADIFEIAGRIHSTSQEGVATVASEILDETQNKKQSEVNTDVARHENEIHGTGGIDSRLSDVEQLAEISIGGGDAQIATGADFTNPDATKRAKVPTVGAIVDGLNDGIYDVSKRNPTGGPNSDGKFTLDYILSNADTLIPTGWRHGGMTISFVHTSDNKYVQFRYIDSSIAVADFTNVANWQGVDDEPTAGSENLVKSRGVFELNKNGLTDLDKFNFQHLYIDSSFFTHSNASWDAYYFKVSEDIERLAFIVRYSAGNESNKACVLYDADNNVISSLSCSECAQDKFNYVDIPQNCREIVICSKNTVGDAIIKAVLSRPNIVPLKSDSNLIGNRLAIIGDSISTFNQDGYTYSDYPTKYPYSNVESVSQCWWYKVLKGSDIELRVNLSYSGSGVVQIGSMPSLYDRTQLIGNSDTVIIELGTNDSGFNIELGSYNYDTPIADLDGTKFIDGYIKGIKGIYAQNANANIICVALKMASSYKNAIRNIAKHYGLLFVDASEYELAAVTGETKHPSAFGMKQIANAFQRSDSKLDFRIDGVEEKVWQDAVYESANGYVNENGKYTANNNWDARIIKNINSNIKSIQIESFASAATSSYKQIAFYDSFDLFTSDHSLGGYSFAQSSDSTVTIYNIPDGCVTIIVTGRIENGGVSSAKIITNSSIDNFENIKSLAYTDTKYIKADGSLATSGSWTSYIFKNNVFKKLIIQASNSLTGSYVLYKSVAFYSDADNMYNTTLIGSVDFATKGNCVAFEVDVPANCKAIVVANRNQDGTCYIYGCVNEESIYNIGNTAAENKKNIEIESYDSIGNAEFWLNGVGVHSDMTWVGNTLVGFDAQVGESQDPTQENAARIHVYSFPNGIKESAVEKILYHQFGHCNTVDYCEATDCLIMGNGSGSYNLTGDIIIIPNFSLLIEAEESGFNLSTANALVIHCTSELGTKFNLVWGDDNDKNYNIAYLITANYGGSTSANGGDLETIRKIVLRKGEEQGAYGTIVENSTPFNGTFDIVETYHQTTEGYPNCDQGTCYHNGEIYACIGHDGAWYWRMRLANEKIFKKNYKQQTYYANKPTNFGNASGICFKEEYMFIGRSSLGVMALAI